MDTEHTITTYLIEALWKRGVRHVFGVPGDYILKFYKELEDSRLAVVNTCDEQGAGFAADAYARLNGLGAVCITYCVGGFKVANTTAQAFAEKSPVVVISGAPGTAERVHRPLLHHMVRDFDTQLEVFERLTVATAVLDAPRSARREIDRVLDAALRFKRPVYIELPRDMVGVPAPPGRAFVPPAADTDAAALNEALAEAAAMITAARRPVIVAGVELHRFGLQDRLRRLVDATDIPVAANILSKSVLTEDHPKYIGVYEGAMGRDDVREYVESSDCLIFLGVFMSDINLGIFTAHLDPGRAIAATSERLSIRHHHYDNVTMSDFIRGLADAGVVRRATAGIPRPPVPAAPEPPTDRPVTVRYLFNRLNALLDNGTVVLADPGDAMFAAIDMTIHSETEFLSPAYYTSLGFAVPASIGAQLARPELRPLVLVGDGAFQMSGMELATVARYGLNPVVVVLNNEGYGTERPMIDGRFNDVHVWRYSRLPEMIGAGRGYDIHTETDLEGALRDTLEDTDGLAILDVHLDRDDRSESLTRLTAALGKRVQS